MSIPLFAQKLKKRAVGEWTTKGRRDGRECGRQDAEGGREGYGEEGEEWRGERGRD
jgi:hypothetical protein